MLTVIFLTLLMAYDILNFIKLYKIYDKIVRYNKRGDILSEGLKTIFDRHGGLMRTAELKEEGFYYKKIQQLLEDGEIEQVRRGYYQYSGDDSFSDIPTITTLFPDGVICMESALDYYGYTDRTPAAWHLAVDNKSTRTRFYIDYPIVKPHFIQSDRYQAGIEEAEIDGKPVKYMIGKKRFVISFFIGIKWMEKFSMWLYSDMSKIRKRPRQGL